MSENLVNAVVEDLEEAPAALTGSLEARIAARREALEKRTTELFDVPGYEGIVKVEMRLVGGKRLHQIGQAHERLHDEYKKLLRTAEDIILAATVAFHNVDANGEPQFAEGITWKRLAKAANRHLDEAHLEARGGGRVALEGLIGEAGVISLLGEWNQWTRTRGEGLARELEDFS